MEQRFLSIEEFNTLLNQWNGHPIKITKHEMDDIDETLMELEGLSYSTNTRSIDDYVPRHTLQLNGNGDIETTANTYEPLPSAIYEIPLGDTSLYEFDGSQFLISTERAVYKIELGR
ncbi:hypothetical protein [Virgibacillus ainsalahensis]